MPGPRISLLGTNALLFDVAGPRFDSALQRRIWAVCEAASRLPEVQEAVAGMNNLMAVLRSGARPEAVTSKLFEIWAGEQAWRGEGRLIEAPTVYGGPQGADLHDLAERTGLAPAEVARLHAAPTYEVAAVGAMPGFVYLSGLDPRLATPRRATPRLNVLAGSVIIGGAQAGVMPITAPTGWHSLGHTNLRLFNLDAPEPALLRPGDRLRFVAVDILA